MTRPVRSPSKTTPGKGKQKVSGSAAEQRRLDEESRVVLYQGAALGHIAMLFGMDPRTVNKRISDVQPCGMRGGFPVYKIADVAPRLVKPEGDIAEYIRKMNHRDLPPMLLKEYWAGQKAMLEVQEREGELVRKADVVRGLAEAFGTVRMTLLLISDAVEREQQLTERQREAVKSHVDKAINELREKLMETFAADPAVTPDPEPEESGYDEDDFFRVDDAPEPENDDFHGL